MSESGKKDTLHPGEPAARAASVPVPPGSDPSPTVPSPSPFGRDKELKTAGSPSPTVFSPTETRRRKEKNMEKHMSTPQRSQEGKLLQRIKLDLDDPIAEEEIPESEMPKWMRYKAILRGMQLPQTTDKWAKARIVILDALTPRHDADDPALLLAGVIKKIQMLHYMDSASPLCSPPGSPKLNVSPEGAASSVTEAAQRVASLKLDGLMAIMKGLTASSAKRARLLVRRICGLAVSAEELFPSGVVPTIPARLYDTVVLKRIQVASLICNAFLGTFYFVGLDFGILALMGLHPGVSPVLQGIVHYLRRVFALIGSNIDKDKLKKDSFLAMREGFMTGTISVTRGIVKPEDVPRWEESTMRLAKVECNKDGSIEMSSHDHRMIVSSEHTGSAFYNVSSALVSEDAMFGIVSPELIVARLILQNSLENNEAAIIEGTERFSAVSYSSNATDFDWERDYDDLSVPKNERTGSLLSRVIIVDSPALVVMHQYEKYFVEREMLKAYAGFKVGPSETSHDCMGVRVQADTSSTDQPVATGKWGGVMFGADVELRILILWIACSAAGRPSIQFNGYGNESYAHSVQGLEETCRKHGVKTVSQLYKRTVQYCLAKRHFLAARSMEAKPEPNRKLTFPDFLDKVTEMEVNSQEFDPNLFE